MAENLLLEYADGKTGMDLGWGRLDESRLNEVMAIHTAYADLARRTGYVARVEGSYLLSTIVRSIEQAASGKPVAGALGKTGDRVLLLAAHDTNISHISGLMNLSWLLNGYQPNDTPPGGALVFRLWKAADGSYRVETLYIAQTLSQMRNATPLGADSQPGIAAVSIPGCASQGARYKCDWEAFQRIASSAIDPKFVPVAKADH
jgi:4-phytase/acid phosphatase